MTDWRDDVARAWNEGEARYEQHMRGLGKMTTTPKHLLDMSEQMKREVLGETTTHQRAFRKAVDEYRDACWQWAQSMETKGPIQERYDRARADLLAFEDRL